VRRLSVLHPRCALGVPIVFPWYHQGRLPLFASPLLLWRGRLGPLPWWRFFPLERRCQFPRLFCHAGCPPFARSDSVGFEFPRQSGFFFVSDLLFGAATSFRHQSAFFRTLASSFGPRVGPSGPRFLPRCFIHSVVPLIVDCSVGCLSFYEEPLPFSFLGFPESPPRPEWSSFSRRKTGWFSFFRPSSFSPDFFFFSRRGFPILL